MPKAQRVSDFVRNNRFVMNGREIMPNLVKILGRVRIVVNVGNTDFLSAVWPCCGSNLVSVGIKNAGVSENGRKGRAFFNGTVPPILGGNGMNHFSVYGRIRG